MRTKIVRATFTALCWPSRTLNEPPVSTRSRVADAKEQNRSCTRRPWLEADAKCSKADARRLPD